MENFILYMAKVSGLIALFYLAYYLLLKKETFFNSNRWFLPGGLITSVALPLVVFTKTVWTEPVIAVSQNYGNALPIIQTVTEPAASQFEINWFNVAAIVYALGVLLFTARFIFDIYKVSRMLKGHVITKVDNFKMIDSQKVQAPFSFFNYIAYNSALLLPEELENIIQHEKVHSRQKHSADMLLGQLACVIFWFNPFVWMYKKIISQNLEFIADAEALKQIADSKHYQKTLLKITVQQDCIAITNHFYQSLIKKRIVMLNKKQSRKRNRLKYALILPALTAFMLLFQIETVAKEKTFVVANAMEISQTANDSVPQLVVMEINKDVSEAEFSKSKAIFKKLFDADVTYKNIKRNRNNEIYTITVTVKDKDNKVSYPSYEVVLDDDKTIKAFTLGIGKEDNSNKNKIFFMEVEDSNSVQAEKVAPKATPQTTEEYIQNGNKGLNRLVIINGVKQKDGIINIPQGQRIHTMTELDAKSAVKKYGKEAKGGAVELTTISNDGAATTIVINDAFKELSKVPFSESVFDNMPNTRRVTVTTTINETTDNDEPGLTVIGNIEPQSNSMFLVMKNSREKDLQYYKAGLKKMEIEMTYSDITRDKDGNITGIKIELSDTRTGTKSSAAWEASRNLNGVPDILVGRKSGQLIVSSNN